ncbi:MAG: hypothetical protein WCF18_06460 [Chthoniobacteraceae bacterium]
MSADATTTFAMGAVFLILGRFVSFDPFSFLELIEAVFGVFFFGL